MASQDRCSMGKGHGQSVKATRSGYVLWIITCRRLAALGVWPNRANKDEQGPAGQQAAEWQQHSPREKGTRA